MATAGVPAADRPGTTSDLGPVSPVPAAVTERDWVIDLARIGALGVVVLLHWLYLKVSVTDGVMSTELALKGPLFWVLSWVLMVMPLFFLAGGYANTKVLDRGRARGAGALAFLAGRVRRLLSPVFFLVLVTFLVVSLIGAVDPGAAARLTDRAGLHLWFVAVFLACTALTPLALRSHDRHGPWALPALLVAGSLGVDAARYTGYLDYEAARWPSLLLVWLCCHQWGILYARGVFARTSAMRLAMVAAACAGALAVMVGWGPYPVANVGMADVVGTNLMPPTTVMSVLGLVQACLLALLAMRLADRRPGPALAGLIAWANPRLMLVYLWHVPALAAVTFIGLLAPDILLPTDTAWWWALRPMWILLSLVVLWGCLRAAGAWELQVAQFGHRAAGSRGVAAAVMGVSGVAILWRAGIGPAALPLLGGVLVLLALLVLITPARESDARAAGVRTRAT